MKLRVYMNDWSINMGIVGFLNIISDTEYFEEIEKSKSYKKENYIEFDSSILENFHEYYFEYFMNEYDLSKKIDDLKSKISDESSDVKEDAKAEYEEQLKNLEEKKADLQDKFKDLADSAEDKWEDAKDAFSDAADSLSDTLSKGVDKVKGFFK